MRGSRSLLQIILGFIILGAYAVFIYMWFGPIGSVPSDSQIAEQVQQEVYFQDDN